MQPLCRTVLHAAAEGGRRSAAIIQHLVSLRADPFTCDKHGTSPLHLASTAAAADALLDAAARNAAPGGGTGRGVLALVSLADKRGRTAVHSSVLRVR
jgi:ankyrin repeat protein